MGRPKKIQPFSFKWFLRRPVKSRRRKEGRVFLQLTETSSMTNWRQGTVRRPGHTEVIELRVGEEFGFDCETKNIHPNGAEDIERWKVRFKLVPEPVE